jgi:hypothetical protein
MKHPSSRKLFAHWDLRRSAGGVPERSEIEPGAIGAALGDTFVLAFDPAVGNIFRLAGSRACALFGRELRDAAFTTIWDVDDRPAIAGMLAAVGSEKVAGIARATTQTAEQFELQLECLLLPLRHGGRTQQRMIGTLAPLAPPVWLGASPVAPLRLTGLRHIELQSAGAALDVITPIRPTASRPGLVVYDGGRSDL